VNEKQIMERWKEYFSELLNEQSEYQLDEWLRLRDQCYGGMRQYSK